MQGFWGGLEKGFLCLAPMEDVTDTVFREVIAGESDPDVLRIVFTEFTSTDGLCDERGRDKVGMRLRVNSSELSLLRENNIALVAQIWGNDPEKFRQSAQYIASLGIFDGIDINMGCPVKKIIKKNTCSALIKDPPLAREIITATKEATSLPVSVKTRIGFNQVETESWVENLLETRPSAIILHGRIQKQMSEGEADWSEVKKAVDIRNQGKYNTLIVGNGDVFSYAQATERTASTDVDGIMVGRGIFKDISIFNRDVKSYSISDKLSILKKHITLYRDTWKGERSYQVLKRFYKIYVSGFPGAATLRNELMETNDYADALQRIEEEEKRTLARLPV